MAKYYKLHERNPDRTSDPEMKAKILKAKLIHAVGGEVNHAQLVLIESLVPLHIEASRLAERQRKSGYLDKRYTSIQAMISNTMGQLMNSVTPITAKARARAKAKAEAAGERSDTPILDLGAVLDD